MEQQKAAEESKRGIPEIQADYQNLCTKAGHLQYQVKTIAEDLELVNKTLRELNLEAAAAHAAAPKVEAPQKEEG